MKSFHQIYLMRLALGFAALVATSTASAGVVLAGAVIVYEPAAATAVPTLSEWGLMAMVLLVGIMAYRLLKGQLGGRPVASVLLAGVLGFGLVQSPGWIRSAIAAESDVTLADPQGGSEFARHYVEVDIVVTNTSGVPLRLVSVTGVNGYTPVNPGAAPQCQTGTMLAPNAVCYVRFPDEQE